MDTPAAPATADAAVSQPWWTGAELVDRLEITDRTLTATSPVCASWTRSKPPPDRVAASASRPRPTSPLLLDDDEAVAVAVALQAASADRHPDGLETAALSALTKLDQVLPVGLRERVAALRAVTIGLRRAELPPVDLDVLVVAAVACRRPERLRFRYTNADGAASFCHVEPFSVIYTERNGAAFAEAVRSLSARLRIHPSGFVVRGIETIPRLANGKIDYRSLAPVAQPACLGITAVAQPAESRPAPRE
jgi:hypothetical protein